MDQPTDDDLLIPRRTLHDQVASMIRDLIIEGRLQPGEKINEIALGDALGVSRTPLREALRTLAGEGIVDFRPSRGTIVRKWSADDVFAMLEVLAHLEMLAGRLACQNASDEEIEEVLILHKEMLDFYASGDRLSYYKCNQDIHTAFTRLSGNAILIELQGNLQARLKRIRFIGNREPDKWADAVGEHQEMAAALHVRDGDALGEVLSRHLKKTWDRVRDVV